jgi:hypothetical protein
MKNLFAILSLLLVSITVFGQDIAYKEYSYTELFKMIEEEQDTIFKLSDAIIKVDIKTDEDHLFTPNKNQEDSTKDNSRKQRIINKAIDFNNVRFLGYSDRQDGLTRRNGLNNIVFEENVTIANSYPLHIDHCVFKSRFEFDIQEYRRPSDSNRENSGNLFNANKVSIINSSFLYSANIGAFPGGKDAYIVLNILDNRFNGNGKYTSVYLFDLELVLFGNNIFNINGYYNLQFEQLNHLIFEDNKFIKGLPDFYCIEIDELVFKKNLFQVPSLINFKAINNVNFIGGNQFKAKTSSSEGFNEYLDYLRIQNPNIHYSQLTTLENYQAYEASHKVENLTAFEFEIEQKSVFYNYFKNKFNTTEANKYYTEIKTLENERINYEHNLNPTFKTFFKLRINKFLKVFSNYGTEPERAVMVSIYVILLFALIYLFFPNSWDSHGRKRIVDRYTFFLKYMDKKAGIHEVYLDDKRQSLLEFEEFKDLIASKENKVPKFFITTAKPLYKWAVSGTRLSAAVLKRIDIISGSWDELPTSKRLWKSMLLTGAFVLALFYDIFIKMLNALMLSINTFTTLGFGEIPIKGLPRYLAIIQGFIGWFMLTIFSVSLISQLLN